MSKKRNAPPGSSPVGALCVLAKNKTHSTGRPIAEAAGVHPATHCPNNSDFEIYRRRYGDVTTAFVAHPTPVKPRAPIARREPGRPLEADAIIAMRASRLLSSLGRVARHRRECGFASVAAWDGVVALAAELIAARAGAAGKSVAVADLRQWAKRNCPDAWQSAIEHAWAETAGVSAVVPEPAEAGDRVNLRLSEWITLGRPWGLHPADAKREEIKSIQKTARRERKRLYAKDKRAAEGAKPHEHSIAEFCRRHGLRERMYRYYRDKGAEALAGWFARNGIHEALSENVASQSKKKENRSHVSRQTIEPVHRVPNRMISAAPRVCAPLARNAHAIRPLGAAERAATAHLQQFQAGDRA